MWRGIIISYRIFVEYIFPSTSCVWAERCQNFLKVVFFYLLVRGEVSVCTFHSRSDCRTLTPGHFITQSFKGFERNKLKVIANLHCECNWSFKFCGSTGSRRCKHTAGVRCARTHAFSFQNKVLFQHFIGMQ